jgi:hypothetical protein
MAATGTAMAPAPAPPAVNPALVEQKMKLQQRIRGGSGWFMAIAAFSVINSGLVFFNAKLHFIVGLGITQIADGIGKMGGFTGSIAGLVVSLFAAGGFTLFGKLSREGHQWAFIVGMVLYALDGLWLDLAFHAFALFNIYKGLSALNELNQLNSQPAAMAAAQGSIR